MERMLKTPLTAVVVIFICSCVAAVLTFRILESTAAFQDSKGLQLGGAIVGLLVTFLALWRAFHTFSRELGQTDRERLEEQLKNLQNQLVRQNPPPSGYHRLLSEDFKIVTHIPSDWTSAENKMIIYPPHSEGSQKFMDTIGIYRTLAKWHYRSLKLGEQKNALAAKYDPSLDLEFTKSLEGMQPGHLAEQEGSPSYDKAVEDQKAKYMELKFEELDRDFLLHRDDPLKEDEKIEDLLDLATQARSSQLLGVPERTEVGGYPAIKYQMLNPWSEKIDTPVVDIMTLILVKEDEAYIYEVTLTCTKDRISQRSGVYNRVLNSIKFVT